MSIDRSTLKAVVRSSLLNQAILRSVTVLVEANSNVMIPTPTGRTFGFAASDDQRVPIKPSFARAATLSPSLPFAVTLAIDNDEGSEHRVSELNMKSIIGIRYVGESLSDD